MKRSCHLAVALALALLWGRPADLSALERKALSGSQAECRSGEVGVVIPAFDGEQPLGQQVATVLNLQIWQTLRRADGVGWQDRGSGVVVWESEPLAEPRFAAAEKKTAERGCQLVFWGRTWKYGKDVVAQTYLSILDRSVLWRTEFELEDGPRTLELGLPRRRYEFAPIVLASDVVERYSRPEALELKSEPGGGHPLGPLGVEFAALEHRPGAARVVSEDDRVGWVQLPRLSRNRSEVVDFTGGVVRMLRGDWRGARDLLQRVVDHPAAPASLVIDSLILQGVATENLGQNGWPMIKRAYERNPHSRITARYGLQLRLARLADKRSRGQTADGELQALEQAVADTRHLFADDDPWIAGARRAAGAARN